jgi:hypothetical protein
MVDVSERAGLWFFEVTVSSGFVVCSLTSPQIIRAEQTQ